MNDYKNKCTHYRNGHLVFKVDGTLEFDGSPDNKSKLDFVNESGRSKKLKKSYVGKYFVNKGINKAKRYVRKNNLVSYNS